jgi:hypothetical protein
VGHEPCEIANHRDGCRDKKRSLGGDGEQENSRPQEICKQTSGERRQIYTKDYEGFPSEKVIQPKQNLTHPYC